MNTTFSKDRQVICNGEKIRRLRAEAGMTQEKLAIMSNVNSRTVQRAEKNAALQLETLASFAATLKVTVNDLVQDGASANTADGPTTEPKERNAVVLRHVVSGKSLLDVICNSFSGKIVCNAEPTTKNINILSALVEKLEKLIPVPWETPFEKGTVTLADRLREAVTLSTELEELETAGISVYVGSYTASAKVPHYDPDEGCMATYVRQKHEPVTVCLVSIDQHGPERVIVKVSDEWQEPAPVSSHSETSNENDEIPF